MLLSRSVWLLAVCILALNIASAGAADSSAKCVLNLPVYDQSGARIPAEVAAVTYTERNSAVDVLGPSAGALRGKMSDNRIYFPEVWVGREFTVTMKTERSGRFSARVPIIKCQQRTSLQRGENEAGGDVGWSSIKGRLTGCRLDEDWWIRAMPMFGGNEFRPSFEGSIDPATGTFSMHANFTGERHILVIGKAAQPVRVFAMNLIRGGNNDAGIIDLRGSCPK